MVGMPLACMLGWLFAIQSQNDVCSDVVGKPLFASNSNFVCVFIKNVGLSHLMND
mgnify:CR=1 FL=1